MNSENEAVAATVLLTHQAPVAVDAMVQCWRRQATAGPVLVAYGGTEENFKQLQEIDAVYIDDPELRTRDHPRERQSYVGVVRATLPWLKDQKATHVHLAEFDEIPLVDDLNQRLLDLARREDADVLGHQLLRVDRSNHPHWLDHVGDDWFGPFWRKISVRSEPDVVLSMLGCGSFWTIEAYEAVAGLKTPGRSYLELFLPTAAHHLGYRVRPIPGQLEFMHPQQEKFAVDFEGYKNKGAWCVHPVKHYWNR